ncbi:MAG: type II secretion system protein GspD [Arcobacter sp.]|nr:MAG: type II secretion system protein GspD [Arcobacter sp.]
MKLIKVFLVVVLLTCVSFAKEEKININFKDLQIMDLVKITSKIIDKNILVTQDIKGKVDYISNKPVSKNELVKILIFVLESKGFTLINNENMLRIVKLNEGANSNVPVITSSSKQNYNQMVTEVFKVYNANVDYIASKVRHLISKNAKLVTNKDANTLVLTDFQDNIVTVKKVVEIMTSGAKKIMEVVELKNIQAIDAKKNLDAISKSIFNPKIETEKVEIVANKDNNSLVIIGNRTNTNYLKKYVIKMDSNESLIKRVVEVYTLKNVEAINVIKIIEGIIGKKKYIDPDSKPLSSVDEETNSIVLMGPSDEVEYIKVLLSQLDKDKAQVYVKARIIEVNNDKVNDIGIKYGILGGKSNNSGLFSFSSKLNNGTALPFDLGSIGLDIPTLSSGLALGASISFLNQNYALNVVSEPSILCINNKESSIYVGETISIQTGSSTTDGGTVNNSFAREDIGLTLKVKPRISNDNKVTLEINTVLEGVKQTNTSSGNPDTSKKEVKTTAIVNNGESVIIGGLIEDRKESTLDKVPGFGDIPLLGKFFKNDAKNTERKNLVIIITPYLIPKAKDLTYVRNELSKLKAIEDEYLKKSLIRLKQNQIKEQKKNKEFEERLRDLDDELNTVKRENNASKTNGSINDNQKHQQRMKEYFGI